MNEHTESAAAHVVRQHRTGFTAGVDFTDDSRFIEWASPADEAESAILRAEYPGIASAYEPEPAEACTELGAEDPERAQADDQLFRRVLLVVAVFALAVLAYVVPQGAAS